MSAAAGLGALGFWLFIAVVVGGGIWYDAKRKEIQQETLRRIVESGKHIDPAVIDRVLGTSDAKELERDLKIGALIVLAAAPGLFVFSLFLGMISPEARMAVMGASGLVAFIGGGLLMASRLVERRYADR
ncbi:MAG: hypothetical protein PVG80_11035 [Gammaproteobacteria bacterium]|jgi:hypothetical protein